MISIAVLASVLSAVSAYSKCSPSDVKGPITIPITKVLTTSPIQLSGSIEIIDGCTFKVVGFSLTNSGTAKWFGGLGSGPAGITVADDVVNPSGGQTFTFRNVVGSEVSFRDFNQFRLFDDSSKTLIATAEVPASVLSGLGNSTGTGSSGSTGTTGTTGTRTGTGSTGPKSTGVVGNGNYPTSRPTGTDSSAFTANPSDLVGLVMMLLAL